MPTELILRVPNKTSPTAIYVPLPTQKAFHQSPARYRAILAGLGNGKTASACIETILAACLFPGSMNAVVRWDQARLRDTTWLAIKSILHASGLDPLIRRDVNSPQQSVLELEVNGRTSTIRGFHAKNWKSFGSLELSSFFLDEATECPDSDAYDQLCARIGRHPIGPGRGWLVGIPNAHDWCWTRFVRDNLPGHELFRGTTYDNPFLRSDYAEDMARIYGETKSLIMLMGSFDTVEGRIFELFDPRVHVFPRRQFPAAWPRYAAVDPGFQPDPAAMLRACVDPQGNIILEQEYERTGKVTEQWAAEMALTNAAHPPHWYVIDPSADRNTHLSPVSVMETARQAGLTPIRAGNNNIDQSVARLRSLLAGDSSRLFPAWHPQAGKPGSPRLFVADDLGRTIWQFMNYRMKKTGAASALKGIRPQDHDQDLIDCARYLCLEHMTAASPTAPPAMSEFWRQVLEEETRPASYLEQIGVRHRRP
jgi:hypothetical protein